MVLFCKHIDEMKVLDVALILPRQISKEVQEICNPMIDLFNINFFSHTRAYRDGHFAALMTTPELTEYYISQKYPIRFSNGHGLILENGFYVEAYMGDDASNNIHFQLRTLFNTSHFVFIIEKNKEYDDMFSFATYPENHKIINQYFNNMDLVKRFLLYYKEKSEKLLKKSQPIKYTADYFLKEYKTMDNSISHKMTSDNMPLKKIALTGNLGNITISQREFDCFKLIVKGLSFKETGKALAISPRTVETYVNNLKDKLGYDKKSQLMELAYSMDIPYLFS